MGVGIHNGRYTGFILKPTTPVVLKGSIAGNLFNDANGNMTRQSGEGNLSGRKMFLDVNKNGAVEASRTRSPMRTATTSSAISRQASRTA